MQWATHNSSQLVKLVATALVALCVSLAVTVPAQAAGWHDDFPQLKEIGNGEYRWFGLGIYRARLWSERRPFDASAPFALELTYHRTISRDRLVQTSIEQIRHLFGERVSSQELKRWEIEMARAFRDVSENDQLIGVFLPERGCRFYTQKEWIADIPDQEFATAFFAIWLDKRTTASKLRAQLLGTVP